MSLTSFVPCLPGVVPENAVLHHRCSLRRRFRMPAAVSELFAKVQFTTEGEQLKLNMAPPEVEEFPEKRIDDHRGAVGVGYRSPNRLPRCCRKKAVGDCAFELPALAMAPPPRWEKGISSCGVVR